MKLVKRHGWKIALAIPLAGSLLLAGLYIGFVIEAVKQNQSAY